MCNNENCKCKTPCKTCKCKQVKTHNGYTLNIHSNLTDDQIKHESVMLDILMQDF